MISDLHGHLPKVPKCDALCLCGDYNPISHPKKFAAELQFLTGKFKTWIDEIEVPIFAVAGNHDWIFQTNPELVPKLKWHYLQDSGVSWNGLNIWGTPWQPRFFDWAFNADEPELERKWSFIPDDTDILLLHGPPYGYGDFSPYGQEHTGSPSLLKRIQEIQPKLAVAGHIHSGHGVYNIGDTIFVNASHVNEEYDPVNEPIVIDL